MYIHTDIFIIFYHQIHYLANFDQTFWQAVSRRTLQHARSSDLPMSKGSILQHNFCPKIVMFPQAVFVFLSSGFRFTKHLNQDNQPSNQPSNLVFPSTVFEGTLGVILFPVLRSELFQRCNQRCHEECVISVATTKKMQKSCGHLEKN